MADIDKTLSELGTSVKIEGPDKEVELEKLLVNIPCAPVNTIEEALNDPQSISRGVIKMIGEVPTLASPLRFIK